MGQSIIINQTVTLKTVNCGTCGMPFALPEAFWNQCYTEGGFFSCPLGHSRGWNAKDAKNAADKLRDRIASQENDLEYYRKRNNELHQEKEAVIRRLSATKGQVTKIKNRVANGVCPCCNRTFQNLHRHMVNKHPEFSETTAD